MKGSRILLLTGRPGIGKTTVIQKVVEELEGERVRGFYTEEIREEGSRKGFRLVTLDGREEEVMARVDVEGGPTVSKYGVDVEAVDRILDGDDPLLATVARKGSGLMERAREHPDAEVVEVIRENRDGLPEEILEELRERI